MLEDPLGLDRRLRDAARSLASFRAALAAGQGADHAFEVTGRLVSFELLDELADAQNDPLGAGLLSWAVRIREEHALVEWSVARASALRVDKHPIDAPERGEFTLRELLGHALA